MTDLKHRLRLENMYSVAGATVLITGGGTGLGKIFATAFAANGAKVVITGRRTEVLQATCEEIGEGMSWVAGDISTKEGAAMMIGEFAKSHTVLDTLINCAGISIPFKNPSDDHENADVAQDLLSQVDDDDWAKTHRVNVNGPYFVTTSAIPLLRKSDNPNVIIISSVAGLANQRGNGSFTYGVSKAGAIHLSSMLAGRLNPMKIRVNCICPGIFPTEMTSTPGPDGEPIMGRMASKAFQRCTMGRAGKPEEIAAPVLLLASRGGMYMNDTCINIDGGRWLVMKGIFDGLHLPADSYID